MDEIIKRLDRILFWLEFLGKKEAKEYLLSCFSDEKEIILYHKCDGTRSLADLTSEVNMARTTILELWKKWEKMGIIEKKPVSGGDRGIRIFNLIELGIKIPENK